MREKRMRTAECLSPGNQTKSSDEERNRVNSKPMKTKKEHFFQTMNNYITKATAAWLSKNKAV